MVGLARTISMLYRESVTPANSDFREDGLGERLRMAVGGGSSDATMRTDGLRECTAARGARGRSESWRKH